MQALTCLAMANFCIYWICTHFNLNRLAVTACPVFDDKARVLDRRIFRSECFFHFASFIWQPRLMHIKLLFSSWELLAYRTLDQVSFRSRITPGILWTC